jgi:flavorubredoxin
MAVKAISPDINAVGAIDWDRRLFDELITTPYESSYNSYLIKGSEKTALNDTVDLKKVRCDVKMKINKNDIFKQEKKRTNSMILLRMSNAPPTKEMCYKE